MRTLALTHSSLKINHNVESSHWCQICVTFMMDSHQSREVNTHKKLHLRNPQSLFQWQGSALDKWDSQTMTFDRLRQRNLRVLVFKWEAFRGKRSVSLGKICFWSFHCIQLNLILYLFNAHLIWHSHQNHNRKCFCLFTKYSLLFIYVFIQL